MSNAILKNIQRRQEVAQMRQELKNEARDLKMEQASINRQFIEEQLNTFLQMTKTEYGVFEYVTNKDSSFTRFVSRGRVRINSDHSNAIHEFNNAKENLARVFVKGLQENKNGEREKIINFAGVKNIEEMEKYFS